VTHLSILEYPDARLRQPASVVTEFDADLGRFVDDLVETFQDAPSALGLSAPQVDDRRRILVMDVSENRSSPRVFVNPRIVSRSGLGLAEETCLSVPGAIVNVWRATKVRVEAEDPSGASFVDDMEGLAAVCLQHEMDHFAGKLLVDRMWFLGRRRFERRVAERRRASGARQPESSRNATAASGGSAGARPG